MPKTKKILLIILEIIILIILNVGAYWSDVGSHWSDVKAFWSDGVTILAPYTQLFIFFVSLILFDIIYICSNIPAIKKYRYQDNKILIIPKILFIILEVAALTILAIAAYYGAIKLIFVFGYGHFPKIFLILVIIFDVLYLFTVKFWPIKNIHIKIITALLLFACSAALVTIYIMPLNFGF